MQGLLGLLWLAPPDNWWSRVFGKFADPTLTKANQLDISTLMVVLFVAALIWRGLRSRKLLAFDDGKGKGPKTALQMFVPGVETSLKKPDVQRWANNALTGALVVVALIASVNYFVGTRNNGVYLHRWDAYHTAIGVKYHKELGYFDLYKCSYAIDREGPHHFRTADKIRDLRTRHDFIDRDEHIAGNDCKDRFTPERLEEFRHDLDEFGTWSNKGQWRTLFKDKGFNGTPFYATVVKPLVGSVDITLENLRRLSYIDPILMLIGFGFVGWAFGVRRAALVAILFCVFFPNRYTHMGGSILRFDYAATLMIGLSALKKDKWGLAGGMFAYATMVRVFPVLFAVGVGVKILSDVLTNNKLVIREEHWRFVGWYGGLIVLFFVISLIGMDGGLDNWRTWAENMRVHNETSASYRVGFKHLFMLEGELTAGDYGTKEYHFYYRQHWYWLAVSLLMAPLVLSVRRLDTVSFAAMFGVFAFFLLLVATRYYWGVAALLLLIDRDLLRNRFMLLLGGMLFAATAFDYFYWELYQEVEQTKPFSLFYNLIVGVELTTVIAALSIWMLFNPSLLDVGDDPRLPLLVPAKRGAVAKPVPLALGGKKKHKKNQSKPANEDGSESDISASDASTEHDAGAERPDPEIETAGDGLLSKLQPITRLPGSDYDADAVTMTDGAKMAAQELESDDGERAEVDGGDDVGGDDVGGDDEEGDDATS